MSCIRINSCHPGYAFNASFPSLTKPERTSAYLGRRLPKIPKLQVCRTVCVFGDKGKASNDNESSAWKSLEKAMGNLKEEPSIEELLKQQIEKQEYYEEGGGGGDLPGGGGGGGSGGSGEPEGEWDPEDDETGTLQETGQVIMATIGVIFAYWYILEGEEIRVYTKDILRFIFFRVKSIRLRRKMKEWERYFRRRNEKKEMDPYWLERAIIKTPTWYDSPKKYGRLSGRSKSSSKSKSKWWFFI